MTTIHARQIATIHARQIATIHARQIATIHARQIKKISLETFQSAFVNRTIKNWNQLAAEPLGTSPCKL
jgi:hypothetical protein